MLAIIIGLLICLGVGLVIVLAVAMPHLREGETLLTEEGQDVLRLSRDRPEHATAEGAHAGREQPAGRFSSVTGLPVEGVDPVTGEEEPAGTAPTAPRGAVPAGGRTVVRHPAGANLPGHAPVDLEAPAGNHPRGVTGARSAGPGILTPPPRRHAETGRYGSVPRNRHGNPLRQS